MLVDTRTLGYASEELLIVETLTGTGFGEVSVGLAE